MKPKTLARVVWMFAIIAGELLAADARVRLDGLHLIPSVIRLDGADTSQQMLVERQQAGEWVEDLTPDAILVSSDPSVFRVAGDRVHAVGNGTATLTAETSIGTASAPVIINGVGQPTEWEFSRHVLPILSRAGCNQGACHGALAGKGGFRLSLRGYHPVGDFHTIASEARGRRIELSNPVCSLLLTKPSGAVPHKGGLRLPPESAEYQIVAGWISQGARPPTADDPELVRLDVAPADVRLNPEQRQQLLVTAHYSDGHAADVTSWAKFSSSDKTVADVNDDGQITVSGRGEGAIVVWFSSQLALARVAVPFVRTLDENDSRSWTEATLVDEFVHAKLKQLNLTPSPRCTDAEYLRRAYLDAVGRLPTSDHVIAFLQSEALNKREHLVDRLLASDDFVDYWTHKWSDLLLVNGRRLRPLAVEAYYDWIRGHVQRNTPWDQMVREILTATGSSTTNGATNFYALHQDAESMTENVSQAFLGLSIGCAKCHNHPLEKWTNDQYYAMASFFSRVKAKGWGGDARNGDGVRTLFAARHPELIQPLTGRPQWPTPLNGDPLPSDDQRDRREYLADWLVSPQNPYFARAITNRVWANFFGQGLVEPVDDLRVSNPARNEPLLAALSEYLVEAEFDLKRLMRKIMISEAYQRSSVTRPGNQHDHRFFSRYYPRRLSAEVLLDAISQATDVPSRFTQIGYDGHDFQSTDEYPLGTRAVELHDSAVVSKFLEIFGRNERDITCECERSNAPSIVQVLHISNGATINDRLKDDNSCVAQALANELSWGQTVQQAYLRTLSRYPSASERSTLIAELGSTADATRREIIEDLYWSLMSSREFLFNH